MPFCCCWRPSVFGTARLSRSSSTTTLAAHGRCAMSLLSEALNEYVAMRRNLGFVFREPASLLRTFVAFVDQAGSPFITTELARQWALQPTGAQPSTWAGRLAIARRFAVWRRVADLRTEVPPVDAGGQRYRRRPPQFYRDQDVVSLMQNAAAL